MYLNNFKNNLYEETVSALNPKTGDKIDVTFRPFAPGDEKGIINCIKSEYKDTYFKTSFYNEDYLLENAISDHYIFFVAEVEKKVVGMEIFTMFLPDEYYIEPASQIILSEYRGYHIAKDMVNYTFKIARNMKPSALFVHAVVIHDITQHVVANEGMVPVGFRFGRFLTSIMNPALPIKRCEKYSEGILIEAVGKKDIGKVYLPPELTEIVASLYSKLGVKYEIITTEKGALKSDISSEEDIKVIKDDIQRFCEIRILRFANDTKDKLLAIMAEDDMPHWSYQIIAKIGSPDFSYYYDELKSIGFFFSGLRPLCADDECIYMQNLKDTKLYIDDYVLTDKFRELANKIKRFMKEENT